MRGAIRFDDLRNMPLKQYIVLKKAVDIESIAQRRLHLYDMNRAFSDPTPLFKQLEKEMMTLLHGSEDGKKASNSIDWGNKSDWQSKLKRYQK